jgi:hypothetical protein
MNWLAHIAGIDDPSGRWYLWWSGLGADLMGLGVIAALAAVSKLLLRHLKQGIHIHHHHAPTDQQ